MPGWWEVIVRKPFSLQSVLDYRTSILEMRELELAEIFRELQLQTQRLAGMQEARKRVQSEMQHIQEAQKLDIGELCWWQERQDVLHNQIRAQQIHLGEIEERVSAKRKEVLSAHQDEEALIKLREQEDLAQLEHEKQQELHEADEIGTTRYFRRQKELLQTESLKGMADGR